ncbi:Bromodomain-containing protein 8 [Halotydeus destructor]|nr:Bromodomain-containing protein 8 [Halotydeus destructor]
MCAAQDSPIKGRLAKQLPIDVWSTREKLALACGVQKSGDQNWYSVSRPLKQFGESERPTDWFSQKNCALQYNVLLDEAQAELPKRKRGERGEETAEDIIVRKLTQERMEELKKLIESDKTVLKTIRSEAETANKPDVPEDFLRTIWQRMKDEEKQAVEEKIKYDEWLKEREQKFAAAKANRATRFKPLSISAPATPAPVKTESDRDSTDQTPETTGATVQSGLVASPTKKVSSTSPLLTSLLQSPTAAAKSPVASGEAAPKQPASQPSSTPSTANTGASRQLAFGSPVPATGNPKTPLREQSPVKSPGRQSPAAAVAVPGPVKAAEGPVTAKVEVEEPASRMDDADDNAVDGDKPDNETADDTEAKVPDVEGKDVKQELMDRDDESTIDDASKADDEGGDDSKTPQIRKRRQKAGTPTPSPALAATRRSGRVRAIKKEEETATVSTEPSRKTSVTEDTTDASISEESTDATQVSKAIASKPSSISDSIPNSPASGIQGEDVENVREFKRWQKAVMILWKQAATHRHAALFMSPVTDSDAEGYNEVVKRPMDLVGIKNRLLNQSADNAIRTTAEFQRDMMLLFQNAMMYNKPEHEVHSCALEMQKELLDSIEDFVSTQKQREETGFMGGPTVPTVSAPTPVADKPEAAATVTPAPRGRSNRERRSLLTPAGDLKDSDPNARRKSRTSTDTDPGTPTTTGAKTRKSWKKPT